MSVVNIYVIGIELSQTLINPILYLFFFESCTDSFSVKTDLRCNYDLITAFSFIKPLSEKRLALVSRAYPMGVVV